MNDKFAHIFSNLGPLILNQIHDLISIHTIDDLSYQYANPATFKLLGYTQEDLYGRSPIELIHPDDIDQALDNFKRILLSGHGQDQLRYRKKDGTYLWFEVKGVIVNGSDDNNAMMLISRDIGQGKMEKDEYLTPIIGQQGETKGETENYYRTIFENVGTAIVIVDQNLKIIMANRKMQELSGYKTEELIGLDPFATFITSEHLSSVMKKYNRCQENLDQATQNYDIKFRDKSGNVRNIVLNMIKVLESNKMLISMVDITEQHKVSENFYKTLFENTGAATMLIEQDLTITRVNEECLRLFKYSNEEIVGAKWTDLLPDDKVEVMLQNHRLRRIASYVAPTQYDTEVIDKEGKKREGLAKVGLIPGTSTSIATFIDLTDLKRQERALKTIGAITTAMNNADSEQDLLDTVCRNVVDIGGFQLVWVGFITNTWDQKIEVVASAGQNNGYTYKLDIALKDPQRGWGPIGKAIRTGKNVICNYMDTDPVFEPWRQAAEERGYKASIALPLFDKNRVFGALNIYSNESGAFNSEEEQHLRNMANDLAYAIISMRIRENIKKANQDLESSLVKMSRLLLQAVTSLGAALDVRDPYTAGHQKGVARLAVAIASEMGCTQDQIESIAMASNLHDIGKMSIPSEILSKPSKLTALEFEMIKTHCEAGYEIIRNIEFPWPVAQIILQHHERMNGSGYPHGLNRDNLMLEARIIAVADVVEAMASHRPYRAALGIEAALDEISKNRDTLYDSAVVDACLRLFQDKGFRL